MTLYIDRKYLSLVSPKLDKFTQKSEYLWNFRCNICGDSQKNKNKMRGYIYRRKNDLFFSCHNCGASHTFGTFLKMTDRSLYNAYQMDCYADGNATKVKKPDFSAVTSSTPVFSNKKKSTDIDLPTIDSLPETHEAKAYVKSRRIPKKYYTQLYYANDFYDFVIKMLPSFDKTLYNESRLVMPFYDEDNNLLGFTGRDLSKNAKKVKYITIKLSEDNRKIYGLNNVNKNKRIYVVEGPIDSMFLENSLAVMDATLYNIIPTLGSYDYVFIYDNEPRNKDIIRNMQKTIDMGKNICIWPSCIEQKDVNEMILSGNLSSSEVQSIIDTNTFSSLQANLEFGRWKKIQS